MSEAKFVPGPWDVHPLDPSVIVVAGRGALTQQYGIAEVFERSADPSHDRTEEEVKATARLIATSPAMLAALAAAEPILRAYIPEDRFDGHAAEALRLVSAALAAARA